MSDMAGPLAIAAIMAAFIALVLLTDKRPRRRRGVPCVGCGEPTCPSAGLVAVVRTIEEQPRMARAAFVFVPEDHTIPGLSPGLYVRCRHCSTLTRVPN